MRLFLIFFFLLEALTLFVCYNSKVNLVLVVLSSRFFFCVTLLIFPPFPRAADICVGVLSYLFKSVLLFLHLVVYCTFLFLIVA